MSALALAFASSALAQPQPTAGNLEKLGNFQQTGTVEPAHIPQTGAKAEAIKKTLATKIKLPNGFHIGLYAMVPDARHIAVGPQGHRDVRRHAQEQGLVGHRSRQGARRR